MSALSVNAVKLVQFPAGVGMTILYWICCGFVNNNNNVLSYDAVRTLQRTINIKRRTVHEIIIESMFQTQSMI